MNFIYEPWFICLLISLLISIVYYLIKMESEKKKKTEEVKSSNNFLYTFITFVVSFVLLLLFYYAYKCFFSGEIINNPIKTGGSLDNSAKSILKQKIKDKLTFIDDDIDVGILED